MVSGSGRRLMTKEPTYGIEHLTLIN